MPYARSSGSSPPTGDATVETSASEETEAQVEVRTDLVSTLDVSIQAQILNLLMDLQEEMGDGVPVHYS